MKDHFLLKLNKFMETISDTKTRIITLIERKIIMEWIKYSEQKPPMGQDVFAYHPDWIDEEYNPHME